MLPQTIRLFFSRRSCHIAVIVNKILIECPVWVTCLPPFRQFDVGVLREVWNAVRNDEASLEEGRRGESRRLWWVCLFRFPEKALTDRLIDTEAVHGPAKERIFPQGQVGHQALWSKTRGSNQPIISHRLEFIATSQFYFTSNLTVFRLVQPAAVKSRDS